jgi:hypothetical protein
MAVVGLSCLKKSYCEPAFSFFAIYYLPVWGVEPVVPHKISWLERTGVYCELIVTSLLGQLAECMHPDTCRNDNGILF